MGIQRMDHVGVVVNDLAAPSWSARWCATATSTGSAMSAARRESSSSWQSGSKSELVPGVLPVEPPLDGVEQLRRPDLVVRVLLGGALHDVIGHLDQLLP